MFKEKFNEEYVMDDAPPTVKIPYNVDINNCCYNCTECFSLIEILSINEDNNIIEFKCLNKDNPHENKIMPIKDYINRMSKYKNQKTNRDLCEIHKSNNKYVSYCFNCNCHLCKICLKTRTHLFHNKNIIEEILPIEEELDIIVNIIEDYKKRIKQLNNEKIDTIKKLDDLLDKNKLKENKKRKEKNKMNKNNLKNELHFIENKYLFDIEQIKKKYEEEIKLLKYKFEIKKNEIINKYKIIKKREECFHKYKIEKLNKNHDDEIKKLEYDTKIENMSNIKKLNEMIYNTYNLFNNNYYNSININTLLLSYINNKYINTKIKEILRNKYDEIIELILAKNKSEINIKKYENDIIKKNEIKIKELYEKKIKEIEEEYTMKLKKLKN